MDQMKQRKDVQTKAESESRTWETSTGISGSETPKTFSGWAGTGDGKFIGRGKKQRERKKRRDGRRTDASRVFVSLAAELPRVLCSPFFKHPPERMIFPGCVRCASPTRFRPFCQPPFRAVFGRERRSFYRIGRVRGSQGKDKKLLVPTRHPSPAPTYQPLL